jgi:diketogulonate reductase-like aldo/keto reductase
MRSTELGQLTVSAQGLGCMVYAQHDRLGVPLVPIPGTKRVKWLEQNVAALDVTLTDSELAQLDPLAAQVVGARY